MTALSRIQVSTLLDAVEGFDLDRRKHARGLLLQHGASALPIIVERFPGRTKVDPFLPGVNLPWFADCGELLSLIEAYGREAHPHMLPLLDSRVPLVRFFATYFYSVVLVPEAIPRLIRRLHDEESRISLLAVRTLFNYRERSDFKRVLDHLHERLHSPSPNARRHAARFLGLFRDISAIPTLIAIFERKEKTLYEAAEGALAEITKQQFGANSKRWYAWWDTHRNVSRILWLIEGLDADDPVLRRSAADELRVISGLDSGFDEMAPKRVREDAKRRWLDWWNRHANPQRHR